MTDRRNARCLSVNLTLDRRDCLKGIAIGLAAASQFLRTDASAAADVDWLAEVRQKPKTIPRENTGFLEPLLIDADGQPITTLCSVERAAQRTTTAVDEVSRTDAGETSSGETEGTA